MEYLKFYGLSEEPFRTEPDRRFYFKSRAQASARLRLLRAVEQKKGLSVFVGEPGCGKTTLAQHVLGGLEPSRFMTRLLVPPHASVDSGWLLRRIAVGYGVQQLQTEPIQILSQIYERLVEVHNEEKCPVLLFDEAQMLRDRALLEEFRALLNLERKGRKLLSLVLFGMKELDEVLRLEPALAQRVEIRVCLTGLEPDEAADYVAHRLQCVDAPAGIFTPEAVVAIHRFSEGIPRLINTLADNALFEGYMSRAKPVDASVVTSAAEQLGLCDAQEEKPVEKEPSPFVPVETSVPAPTLPPEPLPSEPPDEGLGMIDPSDLDGESQRGVEFETSSSADAAATEAEMSPSAEPEVETETSFLLDIDMGTSAEGAAAAAEPANGQPEQKPEPPQDTAAPQPKPEEDIDSLFDEIRVKND
jgi:type II secretory pathway predicted ATPase ExeA